MDKPDLSSDFPAVDQNLKISSDPDNQVHGPHTDVLQGVEGGTDQVRLSEGGDVIGGTTNVGKAKMDW